MTLLLIRRFAFSLLAAGVTTLVGCATHDAARRAPRPGDGIAEYQQIVDDALQAMGTALRSLDRVSAQPDRCSPKVLAAFSKEVERLEVESMQVRARSQAMQARGDAYFENWHENLARMKDPRVRERAEKHRPQLQQHFANLKLASDNAREAFKPFLSGLRRLQSALENDPGTVKTEATKDLIQSTRARGQQVKQGIVAVGEELTAMSSLLTPAKC
jgi:hypothetical protein